jgi:hypothetical protein
MNAHAPGPSKAYRAECHKADLASPWPRSAAKLRSGPIEAAGDDGYPSGSRVHRRDAALARRLRTRSLASAAERGGHVAEGRARLAPDRRNGHQADRDDQDKHDSVFHCGRSVFRGKKPTNSLRESLHLNHPLLATAGRISACGRLLIDGEPETRPQYEMPSVVKRRDWPNSKLRHLSSESNQHCSSA